MALAGCGGLILVLLVAGLLPSALPTGPNLSHFDRTIWLHPKSAEYVENDITPRQKMLADVIAALPGRNREQLEQRLGLSLETEYFKGSGRDLIYVLAPERDSFMGIDSEWLLIWLDKNDTFKRYKVTTD